MTDPQTPASTLLLNARSIVKELRVHSRENDPHLADFIDALAREVSRLTQERDKWLGLFNRSEQFQNGPTKRAEQAEADLLLCQQELAETHRCWNETNETTALYQRDLDRLTEGIAPVVEAMRVRARTWLMTPHDEVAQWADTLARFLVPKEEEKETKDDAATERAFQDLVQYKPDEED